MREIKFRAWNKRDKVMEYDVNVNQGKPVKQGCQWFNTENTETVYHSALQQYTGLKDKNGKEIYEGDVCETLTKSGPPHKNIDYVKFSGSGFKLVDIDNKLLSLNLDDKDIISIEVIGNVFEDMTVVELEGAK